MKIKDFRQMVFPFCVFCTFFSTFQNFPAKEWYYKDISKVYHYTKLKNYTINGTTIVVTSTACSV